MALEEGAEPRPVFTHAYDNGGKEVLIQFRWARYLAAYGDVRAAGIDPLLHYVVNGQAEGRAAFSV